MTQSQSRSKSPANWQPGTPEREGLWVFTRLRDFIDNIANTTPARLALTAFGSGNLGPDSRPPGTGGLAHHGNSERRAGRGAR